MPVQFYNHNNKSHVQINMSQKSAVPFFVRAECTVVPFGVNMGPFYLAGRLFWRRFRRLWSWWPRRVCSASAGGGEPPGRRHYPPLQKEDSPRENRNKGASKVLVIRKNQHTTPVLCHLEHVGGPHVHVTSLFLLGGTPAHDINQIYNSYLSWPSWTTDL